jgi:hypothetical protein
LSRREKNMRKLFALLAACVAVVALLAAPAAQATRIPDPHVGLVQTKLLVACKVGEYYSLVTTTGRSSANVSGSAYGLTVFWNNVSLEIPPAPAIFINPAYGDTYIKQQWFFVGYNPTQTVRMEFPPSAAIIDPHAYIYAIWITGYPPLLGDGGSSDLYNHALSGCRKP